MRVAYMKTQTAAAIHRIRGTTCYTHKRGQIGRSTISACVAIVAAPFITFTHIVRVVCIASHRGGTLLIHGSKLITVWAFALVH